MISESARIGKNASIGAHAVIGDDCEIGDGCAIGPGTVLEAQCRLDQGCRLFANVTLGHRVRLGKRVMIHPGAVIGADGFGIAFATDHWEKVPQVGSVVIGDDCEIGANCCIDRGAVGDTVLEEDVRVDNLCQIGHNVRVGAHTAIAGTSGIAGSVKIGKYCLLGGRPVFQATSRLPIAPPSREEARSFVPLLSPEPPGPGICHRSPIHEWQRNLARLRKLDELARKINAVEKQMGKLTKNDQ